MAEIITMPRLSDTMEEGVVAKWLKKVGDKVNEGDILAEIETDKATMDFESFHTGTLLYIGLQEGEGAKVDTLLAIIGKEGEDISALIGGGATAAAPAPAPAAAMPAGVEIVTMPRLSDTMTEGTVATWLKKVGDTVKEGDILAEIETDKATMEFESFYNGTLLHIGLKEGESASVDSLLAIIGPAGTDVNAVLAAAQGGTAAALAVEDKPAKESDILAEIKKVIKEKGYVTDAELEAIEERVKEHVAECEKFAEESPYPERHVMYDTVYEQENYPFLPNRL